MCPKRLPSVFHPRVMVGGSFLAYSWSCIPSCCLLPWRKEGSVPSQEGFGMKSWQVRDSSQCAPWRPNMDTELEPRNSPFLQGPLKFCRVTSGVESLSSHWQKLIGSEMEMGTLTGSSEYMLWNWARDNVGPRQGVLQSQPSLKSQIPSKLEIS